MNPETMSPPAVMCLDALGVVLFATAEGQKMCALWNEALKESVSDVEAQFRLPIGIGTLLRLASRNGCDPMTSGVRVHHPRKSELSVAIHQGSSLPRMTSRAYCMLMFIVDAPVASTQQTLSRLSPSERRVALLVAEGLRNEDIAQRLQRSRRTIESQLHTIFRKLHMTHRSQLVRELVCSSMAK